MEIQLKRITVVTEYKRIPLFFSCKPFLDYKGDENQFLITNSINKALRFKNTKHLILIRNPRESENINIKQLALKLREKFNFIAYFDDEDSARIARPDILKEVDVYFKKQIYKDLNLYLDVNQMIPSFAQYYCNKLGQNLNEKKETTLTKTDLEKIDLAWNLSVGVYPMYTKIFRFSSILAMLVGPFFSYKILKNVLKIFPDFERTNKTKMVIAQFSVPQNDCFGYQRKKIKEQLHHVEYVNNLWAGEKKYLKSLQKSKITISPFGWGEVCFRDTEAILARSLLVKPNMDHLVTWPDVYITNKTYISVDWDVKYLDEKIENLLLDDQLINNITEQAISKLNGELSKINTKVNQLINRMENPVKD